jgi:type I restriction enzyme S subunit
LLEFFPTNSLSWEHLEYKDGSLLNLHYGLIHQGLSTLIDLTEHKLPNIKINYLSSHYSLCQDGDLAFADASEDTNDVGKVVEFINCAGKEVVCGLHTIHGRDKMNLTITGFKYHAFSSKKFRNQIKQLAQGTKVYAISVKNFAYCSVDIPSKDEQLRITHLLSFLDKKLNIEKKLMKEQIKQKKYLLQRLFI